MLGITHKQFHTNNTRILSVGFMLEIVIGLLFGIGLH